MRQSRTDSVQRDAAENGLRCESASPLPGASRRRQRDVLCDILLNASQYDTWLTLDELARLTHYPPSSISAQLRHLRKPEFGGFAVEKRQRLAGRILYGEDFGPVWEYRLRRAIRRIVGNKRVIHQGARPRVSAVA